jgi:hypothetical protein
VAIEKKTKWALFQMKIFSRLVINDVQIWMSGNMMISADALAAAMKCDFEEFRRSEEYRNFMIELRHMEKYNKLFQEEGKEAFLRKFGQNKETFVLPEIALYFVSWKKDNFVFIKLVEWLLKF